MTASVVSWPEFLATHPQVPVQFPAQQYYLKISGSGTGVHSALVKINESYLKEI
jgi:hypothetical protein